jgi:PBP1b-binding outer membrane lipoprotein LpoB
MYKPFLSIILLSLFLLSCKKEQNPFEISKQHIGLLTDSTQVKDLKTIYSNDSIVKFISGDEFTGNINDIEIFEKGGKQLLVLTPSQALDSTSTIQSIRIMDSRFVTEKNISSLSTFKDISSNYKISRIDNLINSVVVSVNEINASFTIDKKELPANLRFDMDLKIEAIHIPENAKIKYFFVNWNKV